MECGICSKTFTAKRNPLCVSCAQASLYKLRVEQAAALLNREKSHTNAEALIRPGNDGIIAALPEDADWEAITAGIKAETVEQYKSGQQAAELRVQLISDKAEQLRQQIQEYRSRAEKQREDNERRRRVLSEERTQFERRKPTTLEPVRNGIRKTKQRLDKEHSRISEARECLCKEAAYLSGLRRVRKHTGHYEYHLNTLNIFDLRDLNGLNGRIKLDQVETPSGAKTLAEQHELISASLDNICRFLGICCFYLSVRLPSEIILPHNDFPHSMILPERSSYKSREAEDPNLEASQTSGSSASQKKETPYHRLLQLDRPLPKLSQDSPKAYAYFVEGVMWLAWDIAWLCRTQGVESINTFEDVCAMGRNLVLLFASKDGSRPKRPMVSRNISAATTATSKDDRMEGLLREPTAPVFGSYSHSSARKFLAGHAGTRLREGWRGEASSHHRLLDRLRNYLVDEARKAEWTFIDDDEWDDELEHEKPVLVGGARRALGSKGPSMSVMTVTGNDGADEAGAGKEKGSSGWMKVRGRGREN